MYRAHLMRGMTLLESLIALVVISLGVLALLGGLMASLNHAQAGSRRAVAVRLIGDLSERLRSNPLAQQHIDAYIHASDAATSSTGQGGAQEDDCSAPCAINAWAQHDVQQWMQQVRGALGHSQAILFHADAADDAAPRRIGVLLAWPHKGWYGHGNAASALYAWAREMSVRDSRQACPAGWDCHLQYLLLSPRCAAVDLAPDPQDCTV